MALPCTEDEAVDPSFYTVTDNWLDGEQLVWNGTQLTWAAFTTFMQLTLLATEKGEIALSPLTQAKRISLLYIPYSQKIR